MDQDGINSKDFIIGALIGGIVGATTALFLAPKSGRELREGLTQQANAVKDKTTKLTNDAYEKGTQFISIAKEKTASASQAISEQSAQIIDKVKEISGSSSEELTEQQLEVREEEVSDHQAVMEGTELNKEESIKDLEENIVKSNA